VSPAPQTAKARSVNSSLPAHIRKLRQATSTVKALSVLAEQVANLLRQLVCVAGWLVLLCGSISLLAHPQLTPAHLAVPGAGALAILQSLVKPWRRSQETGATSTLKNNAPDGNHQ
jgi:hypothetical protein